MLQDKTLFGDVDKVAIAMQRIKEFEPSEGYFLAFKRWERFMRCIGLSKTSRR